MLQGARSAVFACKQRNDSFWRINQVILVGISVSEAPKSLAYPRVSCFGPSVSPIGLNGWYHPPTPGTHASQGGLQARLPLSCSVFSCGCGVGGQGLNIFATPDVASATPKRITVLCAVFEPHVAGCAPGSIAGKSAEISAQGSARPSAPMCNYLAPKIPPWARD